MELKLSKIVVAADGSITIDDPELAQLIRMAREQEAEARSSALGFFDKCPHNKECNPCQ
jgi:hypothetical protein